MDDSIRRKQITETGIMLLETGLVARTWGNVSARSEGGYFLITPSGLDYRSTEEDDIAMVDIESGRWIGGPRKPSGERGVHRVIYETLSDAEFIIHTHQTYATIIGLSGRDSLDITDEEEEMLGGIAFAKYGITGTEMLVKAVKASLKDGANTVFMPHHGVVICGGNRDEAMKRAELLEEICRRSCLNQEAAELTEKKIAAGEELLAMVREKLSPVLLLQTKEAVKFSRECLPIRAQIEDMAQMTGRTVPVSGKLNEAVSLLKKHGAVTVPGMGILVHAESDDDTEALRILMDKAVKARLHTGRLKRTELSAVDVFIEHLVYKKKYSRQKEK